MAKGFSAKRGDKGHPRWRMNGLEIMLLVIISAHGPEYNSLIHLNSKVNPKTKVGEYFK